MSVLSLLLEVERAVCRFDASGKLLVCDACGAGRDGPAIHHAACPLHRLRLELDPPRGEGDPLRFIARVHPFSLPDGTVDATKDCYSLIVGDVVFTVTATRIYANDPAGAQDLALRILGHLTDFVRREGAVYIRKGSHGR